MNSTIIQNDEDLMREYIAGNENSFEELVFRYERAILNFANIYFRNQAISEDITQDIFVRLVEHKDKYNPERPFKPWIYQIARNRIYDELRKKKRWSLRLFQPKEEDNMSRIMGTIPDPALSPSETLNQSQISRAILESIEQLETKSKDLIVLRYVQGLPVREISEILNIPEGTVQSGIHRSLQKLEKILIQHGFSPEDLL